METPARTPHTPSRRTAQPPSDGAQTTSRRSISRPKTSQPNTSRPIVKRAQGPRRRSLLGGVMQRLLALLVILALAWSAYVIVRINQVAEQDQAQPADAIAVFGAAEYVGRPSPIYHARLDHAVSLYQRQLAPVIVTLGGGSDRDSGKTEGGVGRDYLLANGVPYAAMIAETKSFDTRQQAELLAAIAREHHFSHIIVVSDATHLFRIQQLCQAQGLDVYTSPRQAVGHISQEELSMRYWHELLSYTAMQLHLNSGWLHRLVDGKGDD